MTGDEEITGGSVFVNNYNVKTRRQKAQRCIGYCPQFNALIENLTGWETLNLYAQLKGIQQNEIHDMSKSIMDLLDLTVHADKRCGVYWIWVNY